MATGVRLQTCSRHALQRLELLVRVGLGLGLGGYRLALPWLQAYSTQRRLEDLLVGIGVARYIYQYRIGLGLGLGLGLGSLPARQ